MAENVCESNCLNCGNKLPSIYVLIRYIKHSYYQRVSVDTTTVFVWPVSGHRQLVTLVSQWWRTVYILEVEQNVVSSDKHWVNTAMDKPGTLCERILQYLCTGGCNTGFSNCTPRLPAIDHKNIIMLWVLWPRTNRLTLKGQHNITEVFRYLLKLPQNGPKVKSPVTW